MNHIDNVRRAFRSRYSFDIQLSWLQPCIAWLRGQFQLPDLTNNYTLEKIYNQWLHTDISLIADASYLPNDLDLNAKKVQLSGKYALQINNILCISEPYYTQALDIHGDQNENERIDTDITETQQWKPPPTKRVLYLELTDGRIILHGLEYEPISTLDRDTTLPGAKILVSGPVLFRRGMLLLTPKNTQVMGGYVEELLHKNDSLETTLNALSKTAAKLDESRNRFNRLNIKVHPPKIPDEPTNQLPDTRPNQNNFHNDEDEMDEFIRQAYADGMLNDDSQIDPEPVHNNHRSLSYNTLQSTSRKTTVTNTNRNPLTIKQPEEFILISDDDDKSNSNTDDNYQLFQSNHSSLPSSSVSYNPIPFTSPTSASPPPPTTTTVTRVRPSVPKVSLSYTYLSHLRDKKFSLNTADQDYSIKGCFSSLVSNPRIVKNEFELQAYLNDGSDCILVRLAPDLLSQRIGMTGAELMAKRKEIKNDAEKQKFQTDFNERLKKFGDGMRHLYSMMTIRIFSNNDIPMVMKIDEN